MIDKNRILRYICGISSDNQSSLCFILIFVTCFLAELAVRLCHDDELLSTVADCSEREVIVGLCAEARRLTAALIKNYAVGGMSKINIIIYSNILNSVL